MIAISVLLVIISLVLIFIPVLGGYLTLIPGTLTLLLPRRLYHVAMIISGINVINILFMSPILRTNATVGLEHHDYKWAAIFIGIALFHGSIAIVTYFKHIGKKTSKTPAPIVTSPIVIIEPALPITAKDSPITAQTTPPKPVAPPTVKPKPAASTMTKPKPGATPATQAKPKTAAVAKTTIEPATSSATKSNTTSPTKQKKPVRVS